MSTEVEMLCIGGPNAGYTVKAPTAEYHRVRYATMPKLPKYPPIHGNEPVKFREHIYTARSYFSDNNTKWVLVHHSAGKHMGSGWLEYVLERYVKRYRRKR